MHTALDAAFAAKTDCRAPALVAELDGQRVKVVKSLGAFQLHRGRSEVLPFEPDRTVRTGD